MNPRPTVLSIAGLDPSGCAGLLADIKVFESHAVQGIGALTANTHQNIHQFKAANWVPIQTIIQQLDLLFQDFQPTVIKIGIVENLNILHQIVSFIRSHSFNNALSKRPIIIWDPILRATAPFQFHSHLDTALLINCLSAIDLVTPNAEEFPILLQSLSISTDANDPTINSTTNPTTNPINTSAITQYCSLLLKGGHQQGERAQDILYTSSGVSSISSPRLQGFDKRGTGCVLSAAIAANMAKGKTMFESCCSAKQYMNTFLTSSTNRIGTHHAAY